MKVARLRNGATEHAAHAGLIIEVIYKLLDDPKSPMAAWDLARMCVDPGYEPFGNNAQVLKDVKLLEPNGKPHDSVRNIVVSMVEGTGLDMKLVHPIVEVFEKEECANDA